MIGGGILLSHLGTHVFVKDLEKVFFIDWEKTFDSSLEEKLNQISMDVLSPPMGD